jgi:hypothetical protein
MMNAFLEILIYCPKMDAAFTAFYPMDTRNSFTVSTKVGA